MSAQVVPGVFRLPGVGPGVNAYLWFEPDVEGGPILFDTGWPMSGRGLVSSLIALGVRPQDLRIIAVTHADIDHIGRLARLFAVSGALVAAHEADALTIQSCSWRSMPPGNGRFGWLFDAFYARFPKSPVRVTMPLADGDELPGGWTVIHTPGHTPGHVSYFRERDRVLICGDVIATGGRQTFRFPTKIFTEDMAVNAASIRRLAELRPSVVCPGHGPILHDAAAGLAGFAARFPASLARP